MHSQLPQGLSYLVCFHFAWHGHSGSALVMLMLDSSTVGFWWTPKEAGIGACRGESEARAESQSSPFAEGVWQDGGQVYDVHPRGQGADRESGEQLRERARQDAERG